MILPLLRLIFSPLINGDRLKTRIDFICNQDSISTEVNPAVSTLDFIRKHLHLTGTKEGCREGDCGACTILLGELNEDEIHYKTVNSCLLPAAVLNGKHVVTIEGLNNSSLTPIQKAFVEEGGSQCGFCTPGFIVSLTGSLLTGANADSNEMLKSIDGNICRCTGYVSIKRSIEFVGKEFQNKFDSRNDRVKDLVEYNFLPEYFLEIPSRLKKIKEEHTETANAFSQQGFIAAGCTDLFLQKENQILENGINLIDSNGSQKIWEDKHFIYIKASATVSEIQNSSIPQKYFPDIINYFDLFGSQPIRNRATIGGNIINASPIGDMTIFFLALNSILQFKGESSVREVSLKKFYKGYKQFDKSPDEILDMIRLPIPEKDSYINFEKVSRRTYLDIASVNTAVCLVKENNEIKSISISAGGVAPYPLLLAQTSNFLMKKEISYPVISEAAEIAQKEISPISDVRGSKEYKRLLLRQLIFAHFLKLFPEQITAEELV